MSRFQTKLNQMTVRASSSDGGIEGVCSGRRVTNICFHNDAYYQYESSDLAGRLEQILRALFIGHERGRREIRKSFGRPVDETEKPHWNKQVRDFREAFLGSKCEGVSHREFVTIKCMGMRDFAVSFEPETLDKLAEEEFVAEFESAVADLMADMRMLSTALKQEYINDH